MRERMKRHGYKFKNIAKVKDGRIYEVAPRGELLERVQSESERQGTRTAYEEREEMKTGKDSRKYIR